MAKRGSLADSKLALLSEWHPTRNGDLKPSDITTSSAKKVWWQCVKGHEWEASVANRCKGTGCPKCFGESKTSFPEQAIFFYFDQITTAYNRYMVDAKTEIDIYLPEYKIGIEYDGAYFHIGESAEQREKRKQEKLDKLGLTLIRVRELEGQTSEYTIYSKPGANDTELTETIKNLFLLVTRLTQISFDVDIDVARDRNKIYEQYIQSEKENSLATVNPELATEWHHTKNGALLPEYVSVHSNIKVWWKCKEGHEWQAVINSRRYGVGCPYCSGKRSIVGKTDLATINPKLAEEWHPTKNEGLKASDLTCGSDKKVWWQCDKGHEWEAAIGSRNRGSGCPVCAKRKRQTCPDTTKI